VNMRMSQSIRERRVGAVVGMATRGRSGESVHLSVNPGTTCWCCCRNSDERTYW